MYFTSSAYSPTAVFGDDGHPIISLIDGEAYLAISPHHVLQQLILLLHITVPFNSVDDCCPQN